MEFRGTAAKAAVPLLLAARSRPSVFGSVNFRKQIVEMVRHVRIQLERRHAGEKSAIVRRTDLLADQLVERFLPRRICLRFGHVSFPFVNGNNGVAAMVPK
jgi:hypothetical protein